MKDGAKIRAARRFGASHEALERMRKADVEAVWTGHCRRCHEDVKGTLEELKKHKCKDGA